MLKLRNKRCYSFFKNGGDGVRESLQLLQLTVITTNVKFHREKVGFFSIYFSYY